MVWFGLWDLLVWVVALMGITTGYGTLAQRLRLRQCRKSTAFIRFLYIPCLYAEGGVANPVTLSWRFYHSEDFSLLFQQYIYQ